MPLTEEMIRFYTQLGLDEARLRQFGAELDGVVHPAPAAALNRFRPNAPGRSSVLNQSATRPPLPRAAGPGPAPRTAERELLRRAVQRDQAARAGRGFGAEVNRLRSRQGFLLKREDILLRAQMSLRNAGMAADEPASGASSGGDAFRPVGPQDTPHGRQGSGATRSGRPPGMLPSMPGRSAWMHGTPRSETMRCRA